MKGHSQLAIYFPSTESFLASPQTLQKRFPSLYFLDLSFDLKRQVIRHLHALAKSLHFRFKATNNQAEYEALLVGLRLAKEVRARKVKFRSDDSLVAS